MHTIFVTSEVAAKTSTCVPSSTFEINLTWFGNVQEINKLIFNFTWAGKTPKIKRNTIIGEKKNG